MDCGVPLVAVSYFVGITTGVRNQSCSEKNKLAAQNLNPNFFFFLSGSVRDSLSFQVSPQDVDYEKRE
jgi:hypothetical protein